MSILGVQLGGIFINFDNVLLPYFSGVFGQELATNLKKEVKTRHLGDTGQCKVGMEVIFKKPGGLYGNDKASPQRLVRRGWGVRIRVGIKIRVNIGVRIRIGRRKRSGR